MAKWKYIISWTFRKLKFILGVLLISTMLWMTVTLAPRRVDQDEVFERLLDNSDQPLYLQKEETSKLPFGGQDLSESLRKEDHTHFYTSSEVLQQKFNENPEDSKESLENYQNLEHLNLNLEKSEENLEKLNKNLEKAKENLQKSKENLKQLNQNLEKSNGNLEKSRENPVKSNHNLEKSDQNPRINRNIGVRKEQKQSNHSDTKPAIDCGWYQNEIHLTHKTELFVFGRRNSTGDALCLTTQLSFSRFQGFQKIVDNWPGPISAAVYITETDSSEQCKADIKQWLSKINRDNVAIHFVHQNGTLYPVNLLRNVAQNNTEAEYVFMVDVDFIPVKFAFSNILDTIRSGFFLQKKVLLVIPALELLVNSTYPENKETVKDYYSQDLLHLFHAKQYPPAQGATQFDKWLQTNTTYQIHYQTRFEPYVVLKRKASPRYSERFLQYYHNKSSYTYELHMRGWKFHVVPNAYLVHLPHPYQSSKWLYIYKCVDQELQKFVNDVKSDVVRQ